MDQAASRASERVWPAPLGAMLALAAATGLVAAQLEPFTLPTEVLIGSVSLAMGGLAVWTGWVRRRPAGASVALPQGRTWLVGLLVWIVLIATIGLFQIAQFQSNPRETYPTLSSLASIAFEHWPVRAGAVTAWLILGALIIGGRRR